MTKATRERLRALGFRSYGAYLKSSLWKSKRAEYARSAMPKACLGCGARRVQLHHVTYERIGAEALTDIVPLCNAHHRAVHNHMRRRRLPASATPAILRRMFGWTAAQTRRKFRRHGLA